MPRGARLAAVPQFRMKLADSKFNLDHPVWVDDHDFDLDRHVHHVGVPAPGSRLELADLCGHIASQPLDRSRPLWEMWFVDGLDDGRVWASDLKSARHDVIKAEKGPQITALAMTPDGKRLAWGDEEGGAGVAEIEP